MNIAEYIEQNMVETSCRVMVSYPKFAKEVGLKDIRAAKEWIELDLLELFKCRFIKHNATNTIQSRLIAQLFFTENHVHIEFSHWVYQLCEGNPHWLSDILQQTRMNNYIVRGE